VAIGVMQQADDAFVSSYDGNARRFIGSVFETMTDTPAGKAKPVTAHPIADDRPSRSSIQQKIIDIVPEHRLAGSQAPQTFFTAAYPEDAAAIAPDRLDQHRRQAQERP
jgi:hypothetical protein